MEMYILYIDYISVTCTEVSRHDTGILVWAPKLCAQIKEKLLQNNLNYLIIIFNVNVSTPSQTFHSRISLKIIELKTLCMPVSACLFKFITKYCFCINESSLYIVLVCPNLPLDTALYLQD